MSDSNNDEEFQNAPLEPTAAGTPGAAADLEAPPPEYAHAPAAAADAEPYGGRLGAAGPYVQSAQSGIVSGTSFFAKAFESGLDRIALAGDSLLLHDDEGPPDQAADSVRAAEQLSAQLSIWQAWFLFTIVTEGILLGLTMFIVSIIILANGGATFSSTLARLWIELILGLTILVVSLLFVVYPSSSQLRTAWLGVTALLVICLVAFQCTEAAAIFSLPGQGADAPMAQGSTRISGSSSIEVFIYVGTFALLRLLSRSRSQQSVSIGARSWWIACVTLGLTYLASWFIAVVTFSRAGQLNNILPFAIHELTLTIVNGVFMWIFATVILVAFFMNRHQATASAFFLQIAMYVALLASMFAHGFGFRLSSRFVPMVDAETFLFTFAIVMLFAFHRKDRLP